MLKKLEKLLGTNDSYIIQTKNKEKRNNESKKQLIASLTKPLINYYFYKYLIPNNKLKLTTSLSAFFNTRLDISIEDLLNHKSSAYDYLLLKKNKINQISLDDLCNLILKKTDRTIKNKNI